MELKTKDKTEESTQKARQIKEGDLVLRITPQRRVHTLFIVETIIPLDLRYGTRGDNHSVIKFGVERKNIFRLDPPVEIAGEFYSVVRPDLSAVQLTINRQDAVYVEPQEIGPYLRNIGWSAHAERVEAMERPYTFPEPTTIWLPK